MKESDPGTMPAARRWRITMWRFLEAFFLVGLINLTVISIGESMGRQQLMHQIESEISRLQAEYIGVTQSDLSVYGEKIASIIKQLQSIRTAVASLQALGALEKGSLLHSSRVRMIAALHGEIISEVDLNIASQNETESPKRYLIRTMVPASYENTIAIRALSDDVLLALIVICCGGIGGLIAGIRVEDGFNIKRLTLGLAAGFVAFLVIKGGRYLFLTNGADSVVAFNPYSSAFVGILVGMFTERAYQIVVYLVDSLDRQIRQALDKRTDRGASPGA